MNFFLCDDDKEILDLYAEKIKSFCKRYDMPCKISLYSDGERLLFNFNPNTFRGVLFLDIRMPGIDGISVAKKLKEEGSKCELIFLTISKEHYLNAFDVGAFNYLVKDSTTDQRFEEVLENAIEAVRLKEQERILFSSAGEYRSIAIKDIQYFEVIQRVITVHYEGNKTFDFYTSIGKLETQLIGRNFIRIHRSYLVALSQIHKLTAKQVELSNGETLPIGRKYQQEAKAAFSQQSGIEKL